MVRPVMACGATDVYLPAKAGAVDGRFPAIVERTPYNKDGNAAGLTAFLRATRYAVVVQGVMRR